MKYVLIILCSFQLLSCKAKSFTPNYSDFGNYYDKPDTSGLISKDVISRKDYTLIFINKDSTFDLTEKQRLVNTFFVVYPEEAKRFNPKTVRKVTFIIDPGYKGVAATSNAVTRFNPKWFQSHPEDIDVVTHEVMHIVQNYHSGHSPGWLTEGIADYARYTYGVNNKASGWAMPDYNSKQSYKDAYRITARFLVWLQQHYDKSIVEKLDAALRAGTYTAGIWKQLTGKTVSELWTMYGNDPKLKLHY